MNMQTSTPRASWFPTTRSMGLSHTGRVREGNQDAYLVDPDVGLYAVCDGVSGRRGGDIAARLAVWAIDDYVRRYGHDYGLHERDLLLEDAVVCANAQVFTHARRQPERLEGMSTTLAAVLLDETHAHIAHVGDSRVYRWGFRRGLELLTHDHTIVARAVREGRLTPEQARVSRQRHVITRAVGRGGDVTCDTMSLARRAGDLFLIVSDGVTEELTDAELDAIVRDTYPDHQDTAAEIVRRANDAGGHDNITCVAVLVGHD